MKALAINNYKSERAHCFSRCTKVSITLAFVVGIILTGLGIYFHSQTVLYGSLAYDVIFTIIVSVKITCSSHNPTATNRSILEREERNDSGTRVQAEPLTSQPRNVATRLNPPAINNSQLAGGERSESRTTIHVEPSQAKNFVTLLDPPALNKSQLAGRERSESRTTIHVEPSQPKKLVTHLDPPAVSKSQLAQGEKNETGTTILAEPLTSQPVSVVTSLNPPAINNSQLAGGERNEPRTTEPLTSQSGNVVTRLDSNEPITAIVPAQAEPLRGDDTRAEFIEISTRCSLPPHITFIIVNLLWNLQATSLCSMNYFQNMPVEEFVKMHAYGINGSGAFHVIGNCRPAEAQIVLLGETHAVRVDHDFRNQMIPSLISPGDTIWVEGDPKLLSAERMASIFLNTNVLVEGIQYAYWDSRPDTISHIDYFLKLGLIVQRILEVHKGAPYENDTFEAIEISLEALIKECLDPVHIPIVDSKERAIFLENISDMQGIEEELKNQKQIIIKLILLCKVINRFIVRDQCSGITKNFQYRQDSLVRSIETSIQQKKRGVFIAGSAHFIHPTTHQIEDTLIKFLRSAPDLKYFLIYRLENAPVSQTYALLEKQQTYVDFRKLSGVITSQCVHNLFSKFMEEASQILEAQKKALSNP